MRSKIITVSLIAALALLVVRTTAGQVQPVPGPGTGVVTVDVQRLPPIDVGQRGDWKVSLASPADARVVTMPAVTLARPSFVRQGAKYDVTWPSGEHETIAVSQAGDGAWVRATVNGRERWLNLAHARALEELP